MDRSVDVIVVGAGPAGAATAGRLAALGTEVILVERSAFDRPRVGESLAPVVQPLFAELGVWQRFVALAPLPSWGTRSHWGADASLTHAHLTSPYGCGWHVDRQALDRMLAEAAVAAGAELRLRTLVVGCVPYDGRAWCLTLSGPSGLSRVRARLVVDASGRSTTLARRLGARCIAIDQLVAITCQIRCAPGEQQGYVLVESTPDGWWYSAPVAADRLVVMLMTDGDLCGRARLSTERAWREHLRAAPATAARAGRVDVVWGPRVFCARSQRVQQWRSVGPWLAAGDAALAVDPISGSGVARALRMSRSCAATARELLEAVSPDVIEAYEAECDRECAAYLDERRAYYGIEQRWSESPFWSRRTEAIAA